MRTIYCIGGTPTAGKSTAAGTIAARHGIPWIETDTIRGVMRDLLGKKEAPHLFLYTGLTANEYLNSKSALEIAQDQVTESRATWPGIRSFIRWGGNWDTYIIEGIAVLPEFIHMLQDDGKATVVPVFLLDENPASIRQSIFVRGLWDDPDTYSDTLKEKEIAWVLEFNTLLKKQLKQWPYPVVTVTNKTMLPQQVEEQFDRIRKIGAVAKR